MVKNPPAMQETWVWPLGWEDFLEEGMATHSSILAWRIPWTEETGRLQSMGSKTAGHDWATKTQTARHGNDGPGRCSEPHSGLLSQGSLPLTSSCHDKMPFHRSGLLDTPPSLSFVLALLLESPPLVLCPFLHWAPLHSQTAMNRMLVSLWICPLKLQSQCDGFWRGEVIRPWGGALRMGQCSDKKQKRTLSPSFYHMKTPREVGHLYPRRGLPPEPGHTGTPRSNTRGIDQTRSLVSL